MPTSLCVLCGKVFFLRERVSCGSASKARGKLKPEAASGPGISFDAGRGSPKIPSSMPQPGGHSSLEPGAGTGSAWSPLRVTELLVEASRRAVSLRKDLRWELKSDSSLVTTADREIEALMAAEFDRPERGLRLIGEETVATKGEEYIQAALEGTTYIVDPIDGTSPYAHHLPNWGISLGLLQDGRLTDGAVILPDYCLIVLSDGPRVLAGTREEGDARWTFRELSPQPVETGPSGIIVLTQEMMKAGRLDVPNPLVALGAAVVPLFCMPLGRFLAYVGTLRVWDLAGSLPLLDRLNFQVSRFRAEPGNRLGLEVGKEGYFLDPGDSYRWGVRGGLLACPASEEARIRAAF